MSKEAPTKEHHSRKERSLSHFMQGLLIRAILWQLRRGLEENPPEGAMLEKLLSEFRITVTVEGMPAESNQLILVGYPHRSHLDTAVIAVAALRAGEQHEGRSNVIPIPKGDYWGRNGGYSEILNQFFPGRFLLTNSSDDIRPVQTVVEKLVDAVRTSTVQQTFIMYPSGSREAGPNVIHTGAFVVSALALMSPEADPVTVLVQPTEIINMLPELKNKDITVVQLLSLIRSAMKRKKTGNHEITVRFHPPYDAKNFLADIETSSPELVAGAMVGAYRALVQQHTNETLV